MDNRRIGLRSIAKKLGVSTSTVSLALRGSEKISVRTRDRVLREAELRGYQPDPKLTELYRQLRMSKVDGFDSSIAVVTDGIERLDGNQWREVRDVMIESATRLGFRVEFFDMERDGLRPARLRSILISRGIQGIVFVNLGKEPTAYPSELKEFSAVTIGAVNDASPACVSMDRFGALRRLLYRSFELGYRKPALFFEGVDTANDPVYKAAYLGWCEQEIGLPLSVSFYYHNFPKENDFEDWFQIHRPDFIIGVRAGQTFESISEKLEQLCSGSPERVMQATIEGVVSGSSLPGVIQDYESIGTTVIESLVDCIERKVAVGDKSGRSLLIEGKWINETSLSRSMLEVESRLCV